MTTIIIIAAITVAAAYLRWATGPVLAAYQVGRRAERILAAQRGQPRPVTSITCPCGRDEQPASRAVG